MIDVQTTSRALSTTNVAGADVSLLFRDQQEIALSILVPFRESLCLRGG
jgi:hypothetical protein